jgi:uncharacterized repeat protein (TIGR03803 family)
LTPLLGLIAAARAQTENILYNFPEFGGYELGPVVLDKSGNVYGLAGAGGLYGCGAVYELVNSGGTWSESDIYDFTCGVDGGGAHASGLTFDSAGNLYGTTAFFGAHGFGVVFELVNSGGVWTETVLYSFPGKAGGSTPLAGVTIGADGNLYGTTSKGGNKTCGGKGPRSLCGLVYMLSNSGGSWKSTVIHFFSGGSVDGQHPGSPLTLDPDGNIYGTAGGGKFDHGVVYKLTKSKKAGGAWTESILDYFKLSGRGCGPGSGVVFDNAGNLYGSSGCGSGGGVVYQLKKSGTKYVENIIFRNATTPTDNGTLALDSLGNVFGTTQYGAGYRGFGRVFELAAGTWNYTDLHDFNSKGDGSQPYSAVVLDSSGNLYGTTFLGGSNGEGIVYQIVP